MTDKVRIEVEHLTDPTGEIMVIDSWESYEIESDMMQSADTFTLRVQPRKDYIDFFRIPGHFIRLFIGDSLQMTGLIEATPDSADDGGVQLQLTGRDFGGLLDDDKAPLLDLTNMTLERIVSKLLDPWGGVVPGVITDYGDFRFAVSGRKGKKTRKRSPWGAFNGERIFKEPTQVGGSRFALIQSLANFIGVHAWMAPDGHLVMARPEYQQDPVGKLFVHMDDDGNLTASNCTASRSPDIGDRYSDYSLVGQGYKGKAQKGKELSSYAVARDPSKSFWFDTLQRRLPKTHIEAVKRIQDKKMLVRKARTMAEENIVRNYGFQVNVAGHRTTDIMSTDDGGIGPLWAVDTIVDVDYQPKAVKGPHYVLRRQFTYDGDSGPETNLTPIPSDIWMAVNHDTTSDSVWANKLRATMEYYAL